MIFEYKFHPLLDNHPMMDDGQLKELVEDVRQHGLRLPVWVWNGFIIEGRDRCRACEILGVRPRFMDFIGEEKDIPAFIESVNFHRKSHPLAERRRRVAELRQAGESLRTIAEKIGKSQTQVLRDLQNSGVTSSVTPELDDENGTGPSGDAPLPMVRGRDGKLYAARRDDKPEDVILVEPDGAVYGEKNGGIPNCINRATRLCNSCEINGPVAGCGACKEVRRLAAGEREPGDDTEAEAQAAREDRRARSRNGKPLFDSRKWESAVREAVRAHTAVRKLLDERRDAGHTGRDRLGHRACVQAWDACEAAWGQLLKAWEAWQK